MKKKLRNKIGKGIKYSLLALTLAASSPEKSKGQTKNASPLEINVSEFENYHPEPHKGNFLWIEYNKEVNPEDKLFEENIKYGLPPNHFSEVSEIGSKQKNSRKDNEHQIEIKKPEKFESKVLETTRNLTKKDSQVSKMLPNGVESIENLSINDALFLSGKITAHKLDYNEEIVGYNDSVDLDTSSMADKYASFLVNALKGKTMKTEAAIKTDMMSTDEVFYSGQGVCRHYAPVNEAVFEVFKGMNDKLKNTYMTSFQPRNNGHLYSLSHEWNKVTTLKRSNDTLKAITTYVDPTWLDTRKQTADNSGQKVDIPAKKRYDAVDTHHFGKNKFYVDRYTSKLYRKLSENKRYRKEGYEIDEETAEMYENKALESQISAYKKILNSKEKDPYKLKREFLNIMKLTSENRNSYSVLSGNFGDISKKQYREVESVYNSVKDISPDFVKNARIDLVVPGSHPEGKDYTTMKELFNTLESHHKSK